YDGGTTVSAGALSFTTAIPSSGMITAATGGYAGSNAASFQTDFVDHFNKAGTTGVVGVETTITDIDLTGFGAGTRLGSRTNGTISGTITPQDASNYRFGGGGGTLTVASNLVGGLNLDVNTSGTLAGGVVRLTGTNTYSGTTTVGSATLRGGATNILP